MKTKIILGIVLMLFCFMPMIGNSEIVYYPMDFGGEIEVPSHKYVVVYDSMYNQIIYTDYNFSNNHYHCATYFAVAICDTNDEYVSVIQSIDPFYQIQF